MTKRHSPMTKKAFPHRISHNYKNMSEEQILSHFKSHLKYAVNPACMTPSEIDSLIKQKFPQGIPAVLTSETLCQLYNTTPIVLVCLHIAGLLPPAKCTPSFDNLYWLTDEVIHNMKNLAKRGRHA